MDRTAFVLGTLAPPPTRVLEVGCGAGGLARAMDAAGHRVVAVDPRAPEGPIFRRTTVEDFDEPGRFDAAVASYSLHHVERLDIALDRIVGFLGPDGIVIIEEFGWELFDHATAAWYAAEQQKPSVESVLAEWRFEHEDLHGYAEMRRALDDRFTEHFFEWRPYLYRCLGRDDLERSERDAIARGDIAPVGFRYIGIKP